MSSVSVDDVFLAGFADAGDADGQTCVGRGGVASHDVDVPLLAGQSEAGVEFFHVLYAEALAECHRDGYLPGRAVHSEHVADVDHSRLVAQVLQVDVGEVEVYALHEQVGGYEHFAVWIGEHGAVVADAVFRTIVLGCDVFGEAVDESELAE